jgi:hypothetical protein
MKKYALLTALLIALVAGLGAPSYAATNLETFVSDITPNPAEPGKDILLNINLKNSGDQNAPSVTATLKAAPPFTIKTVQNEVSGKNICAGCSNAITYSMSVDSSAASGVYPMEFEVSYGAGASQVISRKAVNINIIGTPRIVFSTDVKEKVTPNSAFGAVFEFRNIGSGRAQDIKISTASKDFVIAGGTPVLDFLAPKDSKKITVNFISSPNLAPNVYSIPIALNYIDERGNSEEASLSFGVQVLGDSDMAIKNIRIEPAQVSSGSDFIVTARVQNIGYGDAKEVTIELLAPYSGYKKAFIGKLGRDEDAPAIFSLTADAATSDATLLIKYRDDFGDHEKTEVIRINVAGGASMPMYAAAALLAITLIVNRKRIMKALSP